VFFIGCIVSHVVGGFNAAEIVHDFSALLGGEVFLVPLVVYLHHGGVCARAQTLDSGHGESAALRNFIQMVAAGGFLESAQHIFSSSQHTRECATDLEVPMAHRFAVKHRLEGGHLLDIHRRHPTDFSDFVHGSERHPVLVLLHSHLKQRKYSGPGLLGRLPPQNVLNSFVVLR